MRWRLWQACLMVAAMAVPAAAQEAVSGEAADDPMSRTTEYGIRMTPGMARAIARQLTREVFVRRYELDESQVDEAAERMARRFMQAAHEHEEAGQELIEFIVTTGLQSEVKQREGEQSIGPPKELARGVGERLVPLMPSIREITNGIMSDVRPLLSFKQQLKFTGEIAVVNVALDAFEKNLRDWREGKVDFSRSPFEDRSTELKKDANGQTQQLKTALRVAEARSKRAPGAEWGGYLEQFKKFYALDPAQAASADSLLREYQQRALTAMGPESEWRPKAYQLYFWNFLASDLPGGWQGSPVRVLLDAERERMQAPVEALGEEFKDRLEEIPTQAQRDAADARVVAALAAKGLKMEEIVPAEVVPVAHEGGDQ